MADFDLADLIPALKIEISSPGSTEFDAVTDGEWNQRLSNAFWEAHNDDLVPQWVEEEFVVSHRRKPELTFPRNLQQVVLTYAEIAVLRSQLKDWYTVERMKSGPVEYEIQRSAQVLTELLKDAQARLDKLVENLADSGAITTYVLNNYVTRQSAIGVGYGVWVGGE